MPKKKPTVDPWSSIVIGPSTEPEQPEPKRRLSLKERLAQCVVGLANLQVDRGMLHMMEDALQTELDCAHVDERRKQNDYLAKRNAELEDKLRAAGVDVPVGRPRADLAG